MRKVLIILCLFFTQSLFSQNIIKWEESFDGDFFSLGWKYVNRDSSGAPVMHVLPTFEFVTLGTQAPQNGTNFWRFNFEDANAYGLTDDWLITPKLENIVVGDSITFWCGAVDRTFKDTLYITVSTVDNVPWTFETIDFFKVDGPVGSWHKKSYDLSKYAGQNIYFGIQYFHRAGGGLGISTDHVWIDHYTLTGPGTPPLVVDSYELEQNFPNPFNPGTEIDFSILENTNVTLKVYNTAGELVATLVDGFMTTGKYSVDFDGSAFASGVYFYKLTAGSFSDTKKMTLVK